MKTAYLIISLLISALILGGCSTKKPPTDRIASAELAINLAEENKARDFAELDLYKAKENLQNAKNAVAKDDYEEAARYADQALIDAQLAQEKAQAAMAGEAADDLRKSTDTLVDELNR